MRSNKIKIFDLAKVNSEILKLSFSAKEFRISEFTFAEIGNSDFIRSHISINFSQFLYFGTFFIQIPYKKKTPVRISTKLFKYILMPLFIIINLK